jgi:hypothetical protein
MSDANILIGVFFFAEINFDNGVDDGSVDFRNDIYPSCGQYIGSSRR